MNALAPIQTDRRARLLAAASKVAAIAGWATIIVGVGCWATRAWPLLRSAWVEAAEYRPMFVAFVAAPAAALLFTLARRLKRDAGRPSTPPIIVSPKRAR